MIFRSTRHLTVSDCPFLKATPTKTKIPLQDPFKGWLTVTVTNSGSTPWGDFHFDIFQVPGQEPIDSVFFDVAAPNQPTSTQDSLTWEMSNGGHTLDLFYYADPVLSGQTATFSVYTDNTTDSVTIFGTSFYPTPVPVPGALLLLGSGLIGLVGFRKRAHG
jgi:hypothetical protein